MPIYMIVVYTLITGWTIFSILYIIRLKVVANTSKYNEYIYDSIPSVFTTLGVLGTFLGIYNGLIGFDVNDITASIPVLLEGMKTAFLTSILGIILSLFFGKASQVVLRSVEIKEPVKPTSELSELNRIANLIAESSKDSNDNFSTLNKALVGNNTDSLASITSKVRDELVKSRNQLTEQTTAIDKVREALGGDEDSSLLTQMQKLRAEQNDIAKDTSKGVSFIIEAMNKNNKVIETKFEEFTVLLAKSNTEALVDVMQQATKEFNQQMSEIVNKLVKENFQELNNSVQRMNNWQVENKEMISTLTTQFKSVSKNFSISANSIQEITTNTSKLTNDNSHLTKLISSLQKVMVDDTKYEKIIGKLVSTIDTLQTNTESFDETTNKLNVWVKDQMNFSDSVSVLLSRLEEIDQIKDINELFWDNTRTQLNQGVGVIATASKKLASDLENVNEEFYDRLNDTLQNLDSLIQRFAVNYN